MADGVTQRHHPILQLRHCLAPPSSLWRLNTPGACGHWEKWVPKHLRGAEYPTRCIYRAQVCLLPLVVCRRPPMEEFDSPLSSVFFFFATISPISFTCFLWCASCAPILHDDRVCVPLQGCAYSLWNGFLRFAVGLRSCDTLVGEDGCPIQSLSKRDYELRMAIYHGITVMCWLLYSVWVRRANTGPHSTRTSSYQNT